MSLSATDLALVTQAAQGWMTAASTDPFATFQEGYAKTLWVKQLLALNATVLESSNDRNQFWYLTGSSSGFQFALQRKPITLPGHKPDVRVMVGGLVLQLELKVRSRFGSNAQAGYQYIRDDLDVISQSKSDIFFLATEDVRYDKMCEDVQFALVCPPRASIGTVQAPSTHATLTWGARTVCALAMRGPCGIASAERVLIGYYLPTTPANTTQPPTGAPIGAGG